MFLNIFYLILPVFLLISIGISLQFIKLFSDKFYKELNTFIFQISLPCLLFEKVSQSQVSDLFSSRLPILAIILTLITSFLAWVIAKKTMKAADIPVFVQGCYRSNFAIIGLTIANQLFGKQGLISASVLLGLMIPVFNIIAVWCLSSFKKSNLSAKTLFLDVAQSPLTIATGLGFVCSYFQTFPPDAALSVIQKLSAITLPLALISLGAKMNLRPQANTSTYGALACCGLKLIIIPIGFVVVGVNFELPPLELAILFLFAASPTSIASYVMTEAYGANSRMMGDVVMLSTLFSALTISIWLTFLAKLGYLPPNIFSF